MTATSKNRLLLESWKGERETRVIKGQNNTSNPAGTPKFVPSPTSGGKPHTREAFMSDLRKVSRKSEAPPKR